MALFSFSFVLFVEGQICKMKEELNIDREVLFFRYCNNIATLVEKEQVDRMIAGSPELSEELNAVKQALALKKRIGQLESYDTSIGYQKVRVAIQRARRRQRFLHSLSRVAAILALPLLITTLTFGYILFNRENADLSYTEVIASPGTISRFELPDKSRVWLNSNSILRYPNRFKGDRQVELEGEGYFEVESDKKNPFYVATASGIKVMAYGTQFNVNTEKNTIETVLAEGEVTVFYNDQMLRDMKPGEQVSFDPTSGQANVRKVSLLEKLAWKDGKIIFRNAPLNEVLEQLSRRYNIDIVLHDDHNQSGKYLSRVTFSDETIQQIFSYLEIAAPIKWQLSSLRLNNDSTLVKQQIDVWIEK